MFSGLISHNNKVEGFYKVTDPGWPHMVDLLQEAGYYAGIHGKVTHSSPYQPYGWDDDLTISPSGQKAHIKDAKAYGESTSRGIEIAKKSGKAFLSIHKYFGSTQTFLEPGSGWWRGSVCAQSDIHR
jgi:N-sulfoglucosamine sulfohydrolase